MPTKSEKVLISAFRKWPEAGFTAEDLVIACWGLFPEDFGLQGYEHAYPDSNVVYRHIMGQNSIVKKEKWLTQTGSKSYRVSTSGAQHALELTYPKGVEAPVAREHRIRIDRSREAVLARLLLSRAWQKYKDQEEIVFREACAFWGITPRSASEAYRAARGEIDAAFSLADSRIQSSKATVLFVAGANHPLGSEELVKLRTLDAHLQEQFRDELLAIGGRLVDYGRVRQPQTDQIDGRLPLS
jgi:hypothetical protein